MLSVGANQDSSHNKTFPSADEVPSQQPGSEYE